jgi:lipopolysaccharide cholinephosphotransferase
MPKEKLKSVKPEIVKLIYQMVHDISQLFCYFGIDYWMDGGSCLGLVRHKGLIPHDDDVDWGLVSKDIKKFLALEPVLNFCGYSITKVWFGYKIFYSNRKMIEGFDYSFPFIDIFPFREIDGKIKPSYKKVRDTWPKEWWDMDELFPLQKYKFGQTVVLGPNKPLDYLDRMYQKSWNKIAYREYDHEVEEEVKKVKVRLTPEMRKPAQPTSVKNNPKVVKIIQECLNRNISGL